MSFKVSFGNFAIPILPPTTRREHDEQEYPVKQCHLCQKIDRLDDDDRCTECAALEEGTLVRCDVCCNLVSPDVLLACDTEPSCTTCWLSHVQRQLDSGTLTPEVRFELTRKLLEMLAKYK